MTHLCNCRSPSIVPPGSYTKSVKVTETPWPRTTLWETLGISLVSESSMICLILQHILEIQRIIIARCMPRTCSALTCTSSLYVSRHTILNHCADHWAASPYFLKYEISWRNIHPSLLTYPLGFDMRKMTRLALL